MSAPATPAPAIGLAALDIAGTTVDEGGAVYRVLADVVTDHGTPPSPAAVREWMGSDKRQALSVLCSEHDPDVVERLHDRFVARLRDAYAAVPPRPFEGVEAALATLRAHGVAVALTTGFDRQVTDPLLAALGWDVGPDGTVDAVVCAEEVGAGRPSPAMIRHAMDRTGVTAPGRVLAAGDTVLDVRAGLAARAGVVAAVLTGAQSRAELERERPTHVVAGVAALPGLLGLPAPAA